MELKKTIIICITVFLVSLTVAGIIEQWLKKSTFITEYSVMRWSPVITINVKKLNAEDRLMIEKMSEKVRKDFLDLERQITERTGKEKK